MTGNRWVLVGGVLYLLEFVGIIATAAAGLGEMVVRDADPGELLTSYAGHPDAAFFLAGWLAVTLLGRILVFVGLRHALSASGHGHPLLDFAVAAAAVSVTLEIASYGVAAGAIAPAAAGEESLAAAIDQAGAGLNVMIAGGLGVAVLATSWVMWRSGLFHPVLVAIGGISGAAMVAAQLLVSPRFQTVYDLLYISPLVFWVWMIWAGVVCWRRTPARDAALPVG